MTHKQSLKIAMLLRIVLFFKKNKTILDTFIFLAGIIDKFQDAYTSIEPILEQQAADTTGLTKTKEQALTDVLEVLIPMCRKAFAWAKVKKNQELIALFNVHSYDFDLVSPGQNDYTLISNLITGLTSNEKPLEEVNITKLNVDAASALADIFKSTLGIPQKAKKDTKAATVSLDEELTELTELEEICYDLIVNEYNVTNHEMVLTYIASRRIGNSTKTHTDLTFSVYADEAKTLPVKDAAVSLLDRNRMEITDYQGNGEIIQFKGGDLSLMVKAESYSDKLFPFHIKSGQHLHLDIILS